MSQWRPLDRHDDESYEALHEGVPDWLKSTLMQFMVECLRGANEADQALLQQLERQLRTPLVWHFGVESAYEDVIHRADNDPDFCLVVVDFLLKTLSLGDSTAVDQLATHLEEGGSAWTAQLRDAYSFGLFRRVEPTVEEATKSVISASGRAGQHLRKAWTSAYGHDPDASAAYREAVRAVEAIAGPIILPKDPKATLGQMIGAMRDAPAKWHFVLHPSDGNAVVMVKDTMRLLWTSQLDRHGTADQSAPLSVSLEEAQAAVHLAATLVQWFQSGEVKAKK